MLKIKNLIICTMVFALPLVALGASTSFAKTAGKNQVENEESYYVTERGKKYHKEGCRFIKNRDTIAIGLEDIAEKGLASCGWCFKDPEQAKN